jgi:hypothetical protein
MKTLKIILVVIVIAIIGYFVFKWVVPPPPPPPLPPPPKCKCCIMIEEKIDTLKKWPNSEFCKYYYQAVSNLIDNCHKANGFSANPPNNTQWKEDYSNQLYYAYANKFVEQAYHVFNGTEWNANDLDCIRREYRTLRSNPLNKSGSELDSIFTEIQNIFAKYDEINNFIASCNNFSFPGNSLLTVVSVSKVRSKISEARDYLSVSKPLRNCRRLRDRLQQVPQVLFSQHCNYLQRKINYWSGEYPNYNSQSEWRALVYDNLFAEINVLNSGIYNGVSNVNSERQKLLDLLNRDSINAYNYFNTKGG